MNKGMKTNNHHHHYNSSNCNSNSDTTTTKASHFHTPSSPTSIPPAHSNLTSFSDASTSSLRAASVKDGTGPTGGAIRFPPLDSALLCFEEG